MAIPRASIPQASMQQAQPLLAQFNAARAAAQGQQMPVIQGRGLDPAQLMQMAQGNALQVRNQLNGQANQFIATDPAVDIRARERYLESLERDTQSANRADSRAVFNADRNDARTIYTTENAKTAAALLAEQNDKRLDRDIENRNENTDRKIEADNKLQDRKDAAFEREKNFQLEIADYKDGLARQLRIDQQDAERLEKEALQGKFGGFYADELNKINQYWGEPGKPGQRFQQIQGFKKEYLSSGVLQDPDLYNRFATTSPVYKKFQQALGLKEGEAVPLTTPGIQQALYEYAMDEIDAGGPLSAGFQKKYQSAIIQQDTAARQTYSNIINEAIKRGIIPQRGGAQPTSVPGGVQVQGGNGVGGVQPGGNALAPSVPVAPGAPAPQALIQPTDTGNDYGQFDDAFFNKLGELGNQQNTPPPPPVEESAGIDPVTGAVITATAIPVASALTTTQNLDPDQEFKKTKVDQAALDKGVRDTIRSGETPQQTKKIQGADDKLAGDKKRVSSVTAAAQKKIDDAKALVERNEKQIADNNKRIQDIDRRLRKVDKFGNPRVGDELERQTLNKEKATLNDSNNALSNKNQAAQKYITTNENRIKSASNYGNKSQQSRNKEVSQIRKSVPKQIGAQRMIVNSDPDLKETSARQAKVNAVVSKFGMNPDDFRMKNGLLDESAVRDHLAQKKQMVITKFARRFPDAMKAIGRTLKGRVAGTALVSALSAYGVFTALSRSEQKELEQDANELDAIDQSIIELDGNESGNALTPQ